MSGVMINTTVRDKIQTFSSITLQPGMMPVDHYDVVQSSSLQLPLVQLYSICTCMLLVSKQKLTEFTWCCVEQCHLGSNISAVFCSWQQRQCFHPTNWGLHGT